MPGMDLKQPSVLGKLRFADSAIGPFTNKKKMQMFKETGDSRYIYQNQLDKGLLKPTRQGVFST